MPSLLRLRSCVSDFPARAGLRQDFDREMGSARRAEQAGNGSDKQLPSEIRLDGGVELSN